MLVIMLTVYREEDDMGSAERLIGGDDMRKTGPVIRAQIWNDKTPVFGEGRPPGQDDERVQSHQRLGETLPDLPGLARFSRRLLRPPVTELCKDNTVALPEKKYAED
jgi:hypothetical protein